VVVVIEAVGCGRLSFDPLPAFSDDAGDRGDARNGDDVQMPAGPVLWLPMDGATAVDVARGHTMSCTSCPTVAVGFHDGALSFDGAATYVGAAYASDLDASKPFTIAGWIWLGGYPAGSSLSCVLSKPLGTGTQNSYALCIENTGGLVAYSADGVVEDKLNGPLLGLGTWTHVAMSWDGATKRGFINGNPLGSSNVVIGNDTHSLLIGADDNSGSIASFFKGGIDDVLIYDRALSDQEILLLAQ